MLRRNIDQLRIKKAMRRAADPARRAASPAPSADTLFDLR
jgi:hypothetical protein